MENGDFGGHQTPNPTGSVVAAASIDLEATLRAHATSPQYS